MNGPAFDCCRPGDEQRKIVNSSSSSLKPLKAPGRRERAVFGTGARKYPEKADPPECERVPLPHESKDAPPRPRSQASQGAADIDLVAPNLGTEASGAEVSPTQQPHVMHPLQQRVLNQRHDALDRGEAWNRTNTADQQSPVPEAAAMGIANNMILTVLMTQTAQKADTESERERQRERERELERERERHKAMEMARERERTMERLRLQEEAKTRVRAELEKAIRKKESEGEMHGGWVVLGEVDRNEPDKSPLQVKP